MKRNQSGQAAIEYILVLSVVVLISLGAFYQFSQAFQKYVESYFGSYVACLLETGELPSLGGPDSTAGQCNDEFQPFNIKNGRPLDGIGIGQGGKPAAKPASNSTAGAGGSPGARSGGGDSNFSGRLGSSGQFGRPVAAVEKPVSGEAGSSGDAGVSNGGGIRVSATQAQRDKGVLVPQQGGVAFEKDKDADGAKTQKVAQNGENKLRPKKVKEDLKRKPAAVDASDDEGFSAGSFLRWLLIAAILIALIVFLGGQVMQISKSWES